MIRSLRFKIKAQTRKKGAKAICSGPNEDEVVVIKHVNKNCPREEIGAPFDDGFKGLLQSRLRWVNKLVRTRGKGSSRVAATIWKRFCPGDVKNKNFWKARKSRENTRPIRATPRK